MNHIKIKQLSEESLDEVSELDSRFGSRWSKDLYKDRIYKFPDLSHGAYMNNKLVGFIVGKRPATNEVLISRIAVKKEKEGHGIGKKLVKHLEENVRDTKKITATVRKSNKRSINLHRSCGFSKDKDYFYRYKDEELGLKFTKEIE